MKVLQVLGVLAYGGIESFLMNIYRHIDRNEIQFDFLVRNNNKSEKVNEIESMGGKVIFSPEFTKHPVSNYFFVKKFFKEHAHEYDAIHIHCNSLIYPLPIALAKKYNIKTIILHSHNTCNHGKIITVYHRLNTKRYDKYINYRFACSEEAGKWMFENKPFTVIKNGIDLNIFKIDNIKRNEYRQKLNFSDNDIVIGHIGRFCYQKNQEFIIDLLYELLKKSDNYKLLLIGDGETKQSIKEKAASLGIINNIVFTGNIDNVQDYMQAMDIFVLPSKYEGLGIVAIEAQACGLPLICSTNIPNETKLTNNIKYISLNKIDEWVSEIENKSDFTKYKEQNNIYNSGYDINSSMNILTDIYMSK